MRTAHSDKKIKLGLRLGYALPFGKASPSGVGRDSAHDAAPFLGPTPMPGTAHAVLTRRVPGYSVR